MCLHFFHIRSTSTLEHTLIFLEMYDKNEHVFINLSYGGVLPLISMHICALMTYLSGGYLPCKKNYKVWCFSK